jgi:predicted RNA polymerase sigma factor
MSGRDEEKIHRTIERVARESYGRLVAYFFVHTHDLAAAEDALSEALLKALTAWPRDGVPQNPEAWLLTTARHSVIDAVRHQRLVSESEPTLQLLQENTVETNFSTEFPDERLKLLFVCAHPAIDPAMHTPLMLQTVLGLEAVRIAGVFLISPKTMGQRLVRAKTKIRDDGIQFRDSRTARFAATARCRAGRDLRGLWHRLGRLGRSRRTQPGTGRGSHLARTGTRIATAERGGGSRLSGSHAALRSSAGRAEGT